MPSKSTLSVSCQCNHKDRLLIIWISCRIISMTKTFWSFIRALLKKVKKILKVSWFISFWRKNWNGIPRKLKSSSKMKISIAFKNSSSTRNSSQENRCLFKVWRDMSSFWNKSSTKNKIKNDCKWNQFNTDTNLFIKSNDTKHNNLRASSPNLYFSS